MELHDFGNGHGPIPAHRHLNPDGCLGCWVPDDWNVAPDMYALLDDYNTWGLDGVAASTEIGRIKIVSCEEHARILRDSYWQINNWHINHHQPMTMPQASIFYVEYKYGTT